MAEHVPMSVSLCSNVLGYTDSTCLVSTGDAQDLVDRMGDYLEEVADTAFALLCEDFASVFEEIETNEDRRS